MNESLKKERKAKILNLIIFIIPIIGIFFVFREVIFQSKVFSHLDFLLTYSPYFEFLSHSKNLITPSILSGFPIYVSISSTWFNPINKIFFIFFDAFTTLRFLNIFYIVLAYVFSYLFMRRLKIGHLASVFGGAIFIFSGQVMLWSETIIITNYYFLMPLALYILDYVVAGRPGVQILLYTILGLVLGYGWLAGHVQFLIYLYVLVFAFWVFLVWNRKDGRSWPRYLFSESSLFALALMISFVEGIPQIKAVLDFLPLTARSLGVSLDQATAYAYGPQHLIYYLLPTFKIPYVSLSQSFQNYIGILPLLIFPLSFFIWKELKTNKYFTFFFWVFVFCFTASVEYSPIAFILHQLPFFDSFRETFRVMFIGDFTLAIVVAISIESIWKNREVVYPKLETFLIWMKRICLCVVLPVVTLFSILKIFFFTSIENFLKNYFYIHLYSKTVGGFPPEHYYNIINSYLHQSIDQLYVFNSGVVIFLVCTFVSYLLIKNIKKLSFDHFITLAIIITVANFSGIYAYRIIGIPKSELVTPPKTAEFIKNQEVSGKPFRIFSPLMSVTIFNESTKCSFPDLGNWDISHPEFLLRRELIEPDLTILYGLESADGYEPYLPVRSSEMLGFVGSRFAVTPNYVLSGENTSLDEKIKKLIERKNIYRAMNVKYILTTFIISDKDFKQVFYEELGDCKTPVYIYELSNPYPRYFITDRVVSADGLAKFEDYANVLASTSIPTIYVESAQINISQKLYSNFVQEVYPTKTGDVKEFSINSPKNTFLLIGDLWLPNWQAYVDGVKVKLYRANYIYSAVALSSGDHIVRLEYKK